jgi:LacI family gluconate utilization system Gnt-I transcriptional repressor
MDHGAEAVVRLMAQWPDTDAVICVSDLPAFGALMECHRRGWRVPGRLAVAGFGDFEVARCCHPRLTTVSVEALDIGRATGALLLRAIQAARAGTRLTPEVRRMPFRVLQREST